MPNSRTEIPRISAALIARDEARVIDDCLRSIRGHVDEIVVVDTGSTDVTPDIVTRHGGRLLHRPWDGDFAAPRNMALDAASGDWILYIDADERLIVPEGVSLRDELTSPDLAGVLVHFRPKLNYTEYMEIRLFRNDSRIRFQGVIHERIKPSVLAVCEADGKRIGESPVKMIHVGYEGDLTHKHRRNLPLLERYVRADPDRVYCWWQLGEALLGLEKNAEADAAFIEGIATAKRLRRSQDRIEASLCYQARAQLALESGVPARDIVDEGLANHPGDQLLRYSKARVLTDAGEYEAALGILGELRRHHPDRFFDPELAYDRRIFGEFAESLTGLACFRAGRFAEAAEAYERAAAFAEDNTAYRARAAVARGRALAVRQDFRTPEESS